MSSQDATIALKGILGIANQQQPKQATSSNKGEKKKSGKNSSSGRSGNGSGAGGKEKTNINVIANVNAAAGKKKKRPRKKKGAGNTNSNSNGNAKKNDSSKGDSSHDKQKNSRKKNDIPKSSSDTNFALSAFQSPPPPSNLPLPAFGSDSFDCAIVDENEVPETMDDHDSDIAENTKAYDSSSEEKTGDSFKGLNLAALALDNEPAPVPATAPAPISVTVLPHSQNVQVVEEKVEPADPLTMLMNPSYGSTRNGNMGMNQHVNMNGHYQQPPHYSPYGMQYPTMQNGYGGPNHQIMMPQPYVHLNTMPSNHMMPGYSPGPAMPMYGQHPMMHVPYGHMQMHPNLPQQVPGMMQHYGNMQQQQNVLSPKAETLNKSSSGNGKSWAAKVAAKPKLVVKK